LLIQIKPLSVNKCYKGRRFKNQKYKSYELELTLKLPPLIVPDGHLELVIEFGFSNAGSDIDNCVKVFQDVLQKKYGFNDNMIYRLVVSKIIVEKGKEYIDFKLQELT